MLVFTEKVEEQDINDIQRDLDRQKRIPNGPLQ